MHNNINLISEMQKDITLRKLQIRRFQPPPSSLTTVLGKKPSNMYK